MAVLAENRVQGFDIEDLQAQILEEVCLRRARGEGQSARGTAGTGPAGPLLPALPPFPCRPIAWGNLEACLRQVEQFRDLPGDMPEPSTPQGRVRRWGRRIAQTLASAGRLFMGPQVTFNQANVNTLQNLAYSLRQLELSCEAYLQKIQESLGLLRYELLSQERRLGRLIQSTAEQPAEAPGARRVRLDRPGIARARRMPSRSRPMFPALAVHAGTRSHQGSRPARVALMVPCVMYADAVSADVLGMYQVLEARGHEVCIFAYHWCVNDYQVRHYTELPRYLDDEHALLIYHHSIGWGEGFQMLSEARCKKVIKYHNVTPPHFFSAFHIDYVNACRVGRLQIPWFAGAHCDRYLGDSQFNMEELIAEGVDASRSGVVPPFHNIERLNSIEADLAVLDRCRDGKTNILAVGRLAPNKGHASLIEAFAIYFHQYNREGRLLIVGKEDERLHAYTDRLRQRVRELGLENAVVFVGEVPDHALKSYYLSADVFLMTSEHEGFCVPLIEAMAMKVPIVAVGSTAIPGTIGSSGILWDEPDHELLAHSLHAVVREETTRSALGTMGWARYEEQFSPERIEDQFLAALEGLL
jgi:glycosyltransferase involved in cell wall biosynthesis